MANLKDAVAYFCINYPHTKELSKARLTKMVYLADWRSALEDDCQITDIHWVFSHFGPYVEDVVELAKSDKDFKVIRANNVFGNEKEIIQLRTVVDTPSLTNDEIAVLDFVIEKTGPMYWDEFIRLVYSTYPIITQTRFSTLDLVELARHYKRSKDIFEPAN